MLTKTLDSQAVKKLQELPKIKTARSPTRKPLNWTEQTLLKAEPPKTLTHEENLVEIKKSLRLRY
jgi:hypothetical protein